MPEFLPIDDRLGESLLMFSINQVQLKEKVRGEIALEQLKAQIRTLPELKDVPNNNFLLNYGPSGSIFCCC